MTDDCATQDAKLTLEEIVQIFGGAIPMEVLQFCYSAEADNLTVAEVRLRIENMAKITGTKLERLTYDQARMLLATLVPMGPDQAAAYFIQRLVTIEAATAANAASEARVAALCGLLRDVQRECLGSPVAGGDGGTYVVHPPSGALFNRIRAALGADNAGI